MADRELLTAEDLDGMTPSERAAAFDERIVSSWDDVSSEFRAQVEGTARRLSAERARQRGIASRQVRGPRSQGRST